ncbi:MAG: ABC transporter ATP-binding protein [Armatimonadetes bacterium]|nr:ABC transporter ATP-binding protein [Armatimonadota bacterium]
MSENRITISDLHKSFRLSHTRSLKTALMSVTKRKIEKLDVLRGVSFTLEAGECVALVGRNGAGKSTLLSLISRIYKPTSGSIQVNGRIAPLLELGAGFHPDLTGLENIVFNAAILGLSRKQAIEATDSIVAFAELEKVIDSPVRTYSSGMMARLGFSIATHVNAEILIVDEVLAVGDFAFEEKCYQYIQDYREKGGAVLFVSHQQESIRRVATRCLWMKNGLIEADGPVEEVLTRYRSDA